MAENIQNQLEALRKQILADEVTGLARDAQEWGGADVIISAAMTESITEWLGDQPLVISSQMTEPRGRAVITAWSKELSWLFYQLRDIFYEKIDYVSKYDFYGLLAQSAQEYLDGHKEDTQLTGLLTAVLEASKPFI